MKTKTQTQTRYNKRIKDAKQDLTIHVKAQDIGGAICRDHQKCVVARAIMRQRGLTTHWVDVGNTVVLIGTGKNTGRRYSVRGRAKEQIRFFDENDGRFAPCDVVLSAPGNKNHRPLGSRIGEYKNKPRAKKRGPNKRKPTR